VRGATVSDEHIRAENIRISSKLRAIG